MESSKKACSILTCIMVLLGCFGSLYLIHHGAFEDAGKEHEHEVATYKLHHNRSFNMPSSNGSISRRAFTLPADMSRRTHAEMYQILLNRPDEKMLWPRLGDTFQNIDEDLPDLRPVRYCYVNQATARKLDPLMQHAIAMWSPAYEYSTLRITAELRCDPEAMGEFICAEPGDDSVRWDSLRISLGTDQDAPLEATHPQQHTSPSSWPAQAPEPVQADPEPMQTNPEPPKSQGKKKSLKKLKKPIESLARKLDKTWPWKKGSGSSTSVREQAGWDDEIIGSRVSAKCSVGYGRVNQLKIRGVKEEVFDPRTPNDWLEQKATIWSLTHELGHAIGLCHEHQRPDAVSSKHIVFNCDSLKGAPDAKWEAESNEDPRLRGKSKQRKWEMICSDLNLAKEFFPQLENWMPGCTLCSYSSAEFDYLSSMIYSSDFGHDRSRSDSYEYPLLKHPSRVQPGESRTFYEGGSKHKEKLAISVLDVYRVAELYPLSEEATAEVWKMRSTGWEQRDYELGSFSTTVYPAETPYPGAPPSKGGAGQTPPQP